MLNLLDKNCKKGICELIKKNLKILQKLSSKITRKK